MSEATDLSASEIIKLIKSELNSKMNVANSNLSITDSIAVHWETMGSRRNMPIIDAIMRKQGYDYMGKRGSFTYYAKRLD